MEKTLEQLQQEYSKEVAIYGDMVYRAAMITLDVKKQEEKLMAINQEAASLQNKKEEVKSVTPEVVQ